MTITKLFHLTLPDSGKKVRPGRSPYTSMLLHCRRLAREKYQQHGSLPDYFSEELRLHPVDDAKENLRALAKRHNELSGTWVNWLGTYLLAAAVWQKGLHTKEHGSWITPKLSLICKS